MPRELAETILDSGDTLLTILGDILDFSKIDHNRYAAPRALLPARHEALLSVPELTAAPVRLPARQAASALRQPSPYCLHRASTASNDVWPSECLPSWPGSCTFAWREAQRWSARLC